MEFHQLRYFVELARLKNFSRAAEICNVSQPSLSQQIKKLEEELEQPLLKRTRRGAELTPFGQLLLPRAIRILTESHAIGELAEKENLEFSGQVSIGAIPTIAPYIMPQLIEHAVAQYPLMRLRIVEHTTDKLLSEIRSGHLDFGILSPPFNNENEIESAALGDDELLVALPTAHPLGTNRQIRLESLADFPIVLMKDVHCLRRQSISLCETSAVKPTIAIETAQIETAIAMVEAGLGFSFIPKIAANSFSNRKITLKSLSPQIVTRKIELIWSRNSALTRSQEALKNLAKKLNIIEINSSRQ